MGPSIVMISTSRNDIQYHQRALSDRVHLLGIRLPHYMEDILPILQLRKAAPRVVEGKLHRRLPLAR